MTTASYIGKGVITIGGTSVGNASKFEITNTEDVKEMRDHTAAGGEIVDSLRRVTKRELSITVHDFTQANIDKAMAGTADVAVVLTGLNDANTGHTVVATFPRVKFGPGKKLDLLGDDWGAIELTGTILKPTTGDTYTIVATLPTPP